ncbi:DUF1499 domain-containing protein [Thermomonas sp.]|uniref:DUF1499 domain-containing protein n=1 Tax=Thermomonas sp. TaxID=1971895 RepID=UPI002489F70F|nr:DUF1499 domain-containing protein [Thermomonas sp.]MDI1253050.1 DUF1499 domain-containing protein [Thermomonas sp.]
MKPAYIPVLLGIIAFLLLLVSGPGTRLDLWEFRTGFQLLKWAAYTGLAASGLALVMLLLPRIRRRGLAGLVVALVLGLGVAFVPWSGMQRARSVPPIHDISTDTKRPPEFVAILPLRADAPNSAEYGGPELAAAQIAAYPDLQTHQMDAAPAQAFERAQQAARGLGWEIVSIDRTAGRIEATDTTFWFGFKDDVVIRIEPDAAGSRVDVRSVSRVGMSDVGANAARIRKFLRTLGA